MAISKAINNVSDLRHVFCEFYQNFQNSVTDHDQTIAKPPLYICFILEQPIIDIKVRNFITKNLNSYWHRNLK